MIKVTSKKRKMISKTEGNTCQPRPPPAPHGNDISCSHSTVPPTPTPNRRWADG